MADLLVDLAGSILNQIIANGVIAALVLLILIIYLMYQRQMLVSK